MPDIDDLAAEVEARAAGQPPGVRLQVAIALGRELTDAGDALIGRFVAEARDARLSWTEIGREIGTSKQAVQQRYGPALTGRWTPAASEALDRACEEAGALGFRHVGTEHLLLALLETEGDVLPGVSRERMLATSCMKVREAGPPQEGLPLMPRLKQALEHARRIADGLGESVAGTEHLLAGVLAVEDSMAVEILRRLGVRAEDVRRAVAERLGVEPERLGAPRRRRRRLRAVR